MTFLDFFLVFLKVLKTVTFGGFSFKKARGGYLSIIQLCEKLQIWKSRSIISNIIHSNSRDVTPKCNLVRFMTVFDPNPLTWKTHFFSAPVQSLTKIFINFSKKSTFCDIIKSDTSANVLFYQKYKSGFIGTRNPNRNVSFCT